MCGIAGVMNATIGGADLESALNRMKSALRHRGPDDSGIWISPHGGIGLAHTRLSILDLSSAGHQPMQISGGRLTITYNGEIYNFHELRAELEASGVVFRTSTDTEVILRLYEKEGAQCVRRLRGMFAFALWDEQTRTAFLARDPLGIKPLYFHRSTNTLAFASEVRALCQSRLFSPTLCHRAVQRYFETGSVPEPLTLINEAECLGAGQTLLWHEGSATTQTYWQPAFPSDFTGDAQALTREALLDSVRHHFVSDVPVGVFLSGGIDSTAILALANATGHRGCSTFSIAVDDVAADEGPVARRTAAHFDSQHHEMRLDAKVAQGLFAEFLDHLDQPSIDGLNTFTVSRLAAQHGMKVVLSGLGGDEVFGGYSSFAKIPKMCRWHRMARLIPGLITMLERSKPQHRRLAQFLRSPGRVEDAYASLRGIFSQAEAVKLTHWITGQQATFVEPQASSLNLRATTIADQVSELELTCYMRNQLLRDSDVMSMANGLELRVPFVDRGLFEAVSRIPASTRLQPGKRLLTDAVPEVPDWVVNQKKRGFLFPFEKWLGSSWGESFAHASQNAPVPVTTWYQKWSLFVLRRCLSSFALQLP